MQIITPVAITDAMLVSSSITEADHPAWAAATAYTVGQRVIRAATHSIYQRLVAGTTATAPESDPANWQRVGPTNRWAMFDRATGSQSSSASSITVVISPGLIRGLALLDVEAQTVRVRMDAEGQTVYDRTVSMQAGELGVADWSAYFFDEIQRRRTLVLTDLPMYGTGVVTVDLIGSVTVSLGTLAVGRLYDMGGTRYGMQLGMLDYSKKETDQFGTTTVVERAWAKRMTVPVVVRSEDIDEVARRLQSIRATPVVWIGAGAKYDQAVVYGFFKDWSIDVAYERVSWASITIEGLT